MRALVFCLLILLVSGCDYIDSQLFAQSAPKSIWVDDGKYGMSMMACKGDIHIIHSDGGYQIAFTDADGLNHILYGVKRFSLTDVPALVKADMPDPLPDLYNLNNSDHHLPTYSNGLSIHNGDVVTWSTTAGQARFVIDYDRNGIETGRHWNPVWINNKACNSTQ